MSNISYRRISDKDFQNANFIIDILTYIVLNVKPFFLSTTYSNLEHQEMVRMLGEKCLPSTFYEHVKSPKNFELMNSGKLNFNQAKQIVNEYIQKPDVWQVLLKYVAKSQFIYQYVYSLAFPLNYLRLNKYGIKLRNGFSLCFSEWRTEEAKKEQEKKYLGKNPFNFTVYEEERRHPLEQKPIKDNFKVEVINQGDDGEVKPISIKNDDKYKADVIDSDNKENIPPQINKSKYTYPSTMLYFKHDFDRINKLQQDFDKMHKLPKIRKQRLTSKQKIDKRNQKKEELSIKLAEVDEKIKLIKKH